MRILDQTTNRDYHNLEWKFLFSYIAGKLMTD